tara:strand:- start:725 stop:1999 length:1275 start_codon:yes stop_codon:yes gene_type:complete
MWPFKKKATVQATEKKGFDGNNNNYSSTANWSTWDAKKAIEEGFKSSVPVFSCIKKRYDAVSSIPWVVETLNGDEWEATPNHPLQTLIDSPNPEMSTGELMRLLMAHLDLAGNGYWKKVRGGMGDTPQELWPVMPYMSINTASDGTISSYKNTTTGNVYPADDMCQFKYTNPDNYYFGQSPLQAAGKAVDVDNAGQEWQKVSMQNRAVPDYAISFESDLTPDQYSQANDHIKSKTGTGSAREPLVLSKAKVQQLSLSPVEMDFMNTRRFSREEVCSAYGVPSALIAEMNEANLSNAETARKVFWLDTIIPLMDELRDSLNRCLVPDYANDKQTVRIVYDLTNVAALQVNIKDKIENANKLWAMGVPFNTINSRFELGFDDIDGGDVGYISSSAIPTNFDFDAETTDESKKAVYDELLKKSLNAD